MYLNNGFISYLNLLLRNQRRNRPAPPFGFQLILEYIRALFTMVVLVLLDAAIELLFVILFGVVIIRMSQGRDIIVSMFEPEGMYGIQRIIFTLAAITAFSVSMWLIPAFLFEWQNKWSPDPRGKKDAFKSHLFFAHRILPMIPFWVMAFGLFNHSAWLFISLAVLELVLLSVYNYYVKKKTTRLIVLGALLAVFAGFVIYFCTYYRVEYLSVKRALAVILYLFSVLLFFFFHEMDRRILAEHFTGDKTKRAIRRYPNNTLFFFSYFGLHIFLLLVIFYKLINIGIVPESMLLYVFAFYIFVIDIIFYIARLHPVIQTTGTLAGILIVALFMLGIYRLNSYHNQIDRIPVSSSMSNFSMCSLEDYYHQWKQRIISNPSAQPYPVILVAGEGGGSRAGYWFSQNLIDFDYRTNGKFRDHIFSISTVSGSTVGLGTYFTYLQQPLITNGDQQEVSKDYLQLPRHIYKNNFVGSSISGLFLTDFFHSFYHGNWTEDRNNVLMQEESYSTAAAVCEITRQPATNTGTCILDKEYMSVFYDSSTGYRSFNMNKPLAFINTCRSNDGRRGIFAPVRLNPVWFSDAIDINGYIYKDTVLGKAFKLPITKVKEGITFGQACVASELFPIFSAPLYIDKLGSFVDGGYHENSGLKTTLDIYTKLKSLLENDPAIKGRFTIYILYLKNGSDDKNIYAAHEPALGIAQPVSALLGQPFNGSASYFEERAKNISDSFANTVFVKVGLGNRILKDPTLGPNKTHAQKIQEEILEDLKQKDDTSALNFPLARWLSKSVIDRMFAYQQQFVSDPSSDIYKLLARVRTTHQTAITASPPSKPATQKTL